MLRYSVNKKINGHLLKKQPSKKGVKPPKFFLHMKTLKKDIHAPDPVLVLELYAANNHVTHL